MNISTGIRYSTFGAVVASTLAFTALAGVTAPSFAHDGATAQSAGSETKSQPADNVITDTSTATFDATVKWLSTTLKKNGHTAYVSVLPGGPRKITDTLTAPVSCYRQEDITAIMVSPETLEIRVAYREAGYSPTEWPTEYNAGIEKFSIPLNDVVRVDTRAAGDDLWPNEARSVLITCKDQSITLEQAWKSKTKGYEDEVSSPTIRCDLKSVGFWISGSVDNPDRIANAIRHLAKLSRDSVKKDPF